jgi:hypothetical protein
MTNRLRFDDPAVESPVDQKQKPYSSPRRLPTVHSPEETYDIHDYDMAGEEYQDYDDDDEYVDGSGAGINLSPTSYVHSGEFDTFDDAVYLINE